MASENSGALSEAAAVWLLEPAAGWAGANIGSMHWADEH